MKTKTRFHKLTAWLLTVAMLMTFIPSFTLGVSAAEETPSAASDLTVTIDAGSSVTLKDSDGDGYYEIGTADELYAFAAAVNGGNSAINGVLTDNIVVNEGTMTADSTNARAWTPIGTASKSYTGTFDGNGKTVSGLYFNDSNTSEVGLFGYVYTGGTVRNVGVVASYLRGNYRVGGVVGHNYGTVENCYNTGAVTCTGSYLGGVVGHNYDTVENCYNTGEVSSTNGGCVGGVAGNNNASGTVENCYNTGTVTATYDAGGVVGNNNASGTVTNCYYLAGCANDGKAVQYGIGAFDTGSTTPDVPGNTTGKTAAQLASGEVAYLLNGDQTTITFYQTCGEGLPAFSGQTVYRRYLSCGDAQPTYTNDTGSAEQPAHDFGTNGKCAVCGAFEIVIANDITDGSIAADKTGAKEGEAVTLTVTPAEGYALDRLEVIKRGDSTTKVPATLREDGAYTFTMPADAVTVTAAFGEPSCSIKWMNEESTVEWSDTYGSIGEGGKIAVKNTGNMPVVLELAVGDAITSGNDEDNKIGGVKLASTLTSGMVAPGETHTFTLKPVETLNAGHYEVPWTVTADASGAGEFRFYIGGTLSYTVEKAVLTVEALDILWQVGYQAPVLDSSLFYEINGFVNGEDENVLSGTPVLSYEPAPDMTQEGTYTICVDTGGMSAANYKIYGIDGRLMVFNHIHRFYNFVVGTVYEQDDAIYATCADETCTEYSEPRPIFYFSPQPDTVYTEGEYYSVGIVAEEQLFIGLDDVVYTRGDETLSDYPIDAGTYTASVDFYGMVASVEYTIAPRPLTITADNKSVYVGGSAPEYTYTVTGWEEGHDEDTGHYVTGVTAECTPNLSKAGTYDITLSGTPVVKDSDGNDVTSNYTFTTKNGTLTVSTRSGGGGLGGSVSPSTSTTTTKNDDGSTTKTTTNKTTGTTTEVTTNTDGSTTTVETKKDGTVTTTEKDKDGNTTTTVEKPDGSSTTTEKNKDGTKVTTETTASGETTAEVEAKGETEVVIPVDNADEVTKVVVTDKDGVETEVEFEVKDGGVAISVSGNSTVSVQTGHTCYAKDFTDVDLNAWYHLNVDYVLENGLFKGTTETTFAPNDNLTRAMLVTVLYRAEGEPAISGPEGGGYPSGTIPVAFEDVDSDAYYAMAVRWAQRNGIVNGVSETEFAPNDNITREQIAAILYRYAIYKGMDAVNLSENLSFTDADEISEYAISALNWAVGTGLIKGYEDNTVRPLNNATRAEAAAILERFIKAN